VKHILSFEKQPSHWCNSAEAAENVTGTFTLEQRIISPSKTENTSRL